MTSPHHVRGSTIVSRFINSKTQRIWYVAQTISLHLPFTLPQTLVSGLLLWSIAVKATLLVDILHPNSQSWRLFQSERSLCGCTTNCQPAGLFQTSQLCWVCKACWHNQLDVQVADLIKRRKCACPPEIVDTLLVLQLKDADPHAASKGQNCCCTQECFAVPSAMLLLYPYAFAL